MSEPWIVNASPVITLAKIGHLDLLTSLAPEIWLPEPVAKELLSGSAGDPARQAVEGGFGHRVSVSDIPRKVVEWGLGAGESAVLATALERQPAIAVLDDAAARKCAQTLSIPVLGTLGVVLRARVRELIPSAAEIVRALRAAGLYLDSGTVRIALRGIGERWDHE